MAELVGSDVVLRDVIDRAAVGIVLAEPTGELVFANETFRREFTLITAADRSEHLHDLVHPADYGATAHLARLARGEIDEYQGEHLCNGRGGGPERVALRACLLDGYLMVQLTSIERSRRAEEALAVSESRWQFALEAARQGVWDHDNRTKSMFYSPMWRTIRGIPQDEYVDDSQEAWLSRVHPEDRERIRPDIAKQNEGDDGYDILEYRERHRDGHYVWILSRGKPVEWDEHGNAVRTIGTDTDITHLKQVEARLAAEMERWRVTLEAIADGTICIDAAGRITFMNAAAQEWTGWFFDDAVGRDIHEVVQLGGVDATAAQAMIETCLITGVTQRLDGDAVLVSRDDQRRDVSCSASAIQPSDGGWTGAVVVFQDMTRSRSLQAQLEHAATHDSLTGLANRAAFSTALDRAVVSGQLHSIVFIDLDHFKHINDTFGHSVGDDVLRRVADAIRSHVRRGDVCARLGGDEFVLLLHNCELGDAELLAKRIIVAVSDIGVTVGEASARVGASVGLSALVPGEAPDAALIRADGACYQAKGSGRGRVCAAG